MCATLDISATGSVHVIYKPTEKDCRFADILAPGVLKDGLEAFKSWWRSRKWLLPLELASYCCSTV